MLANRLVESKYDLKAVIEFIATSQAYQSRSEILARDAEDKNYIYRGPRAKRLTAEQFVDAVWRLTSTTPAKIVPQVPRAAPVAGAAKKPVIEPLLAAPIWSGDIAGGRLPAAGETRSFRRQLALDADVDAATCVATCDNGFELYVNGKKIGAGDNWADPKSFDLSASLLKGTNQIVVVGHNSGKVPNVAALFFQVNVTLKGGARVRMATDTAWESTTSVPKLIKQHPNRQNLTKPSVEAINTKRRMWQTKQSKRSEQQFCKPELQGKLRWDAAVVDGGPKAVTLALRRKVKLKQSKLST